MVLISIFSILISHLLRNNLIYKSNIFENNSQIFYKITFICLYFKCVFFKHYFTKQTVLGIRIEVKEIVYLAEPELKTFLSKFSQSGGI
jgi:hypothetical protein